MAGQYTDKFTAASEDLREKSGFVCESCKKTYSRGGAIKKDLTCCNRTLRELTQESFGP